MKRDELLSKILKLPSELFKWYLNSLMVTGALMGFVLFLYILLFASIHPLAKPVGGLILFAILFTVFAKIQELYRRIRPGIWSEEQSEEQEELTEVTKSESVEQRLIGTPMNFKTKDGKSSVKGIYLASNSTHVKLKRIDNQRKLSSN